jgi:hypothetical protein
MGRLGFGFLVLWLAIGSAALAVAQQPGDRTAAREAYARGQELFREGRFAEAEAAFRGAYEMIPLPVVLLGIAEAQERQDNIVGTVETLERYLAERADAPDRAQVEERIGQLRQRPATLVISTSPPGAAISVDGEVVAQPMGHEVEFEVAPGSHEVSATLDGYESASETVAATFGTRHEITLTLARAEQEPAPTPPPSEPVVAPPDDAEGEIGPEVYVAGGVALAGVAAGTVLGLLALSEQSDFDAMPTEETADAGERLALFADLSFGVAAVAGVTMAVLLATSASGGDDSEESPGAAARVVPFIAQSGAGVACGGRF